MTKSQNEDDYVMYLIVRESLGMSPGKIGAQCGHAVQKIMEEYYRYIALGNQFIATAEWLENYYTKIVLKANDKEFEKIKKEFFTDAEFKCSLVVDKGLTEIASNTETILGLWPMKRSEVPKLIKRLQLLK